MTPSEGLPTPPTQSIVYEDNYLYVCQALQPITRGHLIVVWKRNARDIHELTDSEYDYLMEMVDITRDVLLEILGVEKVYLVYMDEIKQVHWHLIPRYTKKGFEVFTSNEKLEPDFTNTETLSELFSKRKQLRTLKEPQGN